MAGVEPRNEVIEISAYVSAGVYFSGAFEGRERNGIYLEVFVYLWCRDRVIVCKTCRFHIVVVG